MLVVVVEFCQPPRHAATRPSRETCSPIISSSRVRATPRLACVCRWVSTIGIIYATACSHVGRLVQSDRRQPRRRTVSTFLCMGDQATLREPRTFLLTTIVDIRRPPASPPLSLPSLSNPSSPCPTPLYPILPSPCSSSSPLSPV